MEESEILFDSVGNKAIVTFNRPKNFNSFNLRNVLKLRKITESCKKNKILVIYKGAGDRAFSSGGDLKACLSSDGPSWPEFLREAYTSIYLLHRPNCPVATVSLVNGLAMGGGAATAVFSHYTVATEKTIFAMPEGAVGLVPDIGSSYYLSRIPGNIGVYLALTGNRLFGADMLRCGLASHFCHSSYLPELEQSLVSKKVSTPKQIEGILQKFNDQSSMDESKIAPNMKMIEECFSHNIGVEEVILRLKKHENGNNVIARLNNLSPLVLKIIKKQIKLGRTMELLDCLKMEYRLNFRLAKHQNFSEGLKTLLVEKGRKPNWIPATLEEVTNEMVDEYFEPLEPDEELQLPNVSYSNTKYALPCSKL